jgi:transcription elongation factor Elf1
MKGFQMANCFICNNEALEKNSNIHEPEYNCSECGEYSITDIAQNIIPIEGYPDWSKRIQDYIINNQESGRVVITTDTIKTIFGF